MLLNKHKYRFIIITASIVSLYSFYFFMSNKVYLIGSDAYYYMSIADSIIQNGEMRDLTFVPSRPIKSPQNGIAFVHVLLSLLGLSHKAGQLVIVFINYMAYLGGIYPLLMISRHFGLTKKLPLVALLSVYLGAWHIYRINLLAINDGIFNSLILWLAYFFIKFFHSSNELSSFLLSRNTAKIYLTILFLTIVSIQFRVTAILVIGSAVIGGVIVRNYRASVWSLLGVTLMLLSIFSIFHTFVGVSPLDITHFKLSENFRELFSNVVSYKIKLILWKILPRLTAGLSPLSNSFATLCFTVFPISMFYYLYRGYVTQSFAKVFLALICLTGLWFTMKFSNARVIFYSFPFMYLLLLGYRKTRFIAYVFVFIVFLQSFQTFFQGFWRGPKSQLFLHIYNEQISLQQNNSLLLTNSGRHAYFFLKSKPYRGSINDHGILNVPEEFSFDLVKEKKRVNVLGDSTFIANTFYYIKEMASLNGYQLESTPLTPDLDEFEGWALVEFSAEKKSS